MTWEIENERGGYEGWWETNEVQGETESFFGWERIRWAELHTPWSPPKLPFWPFFPLASVLPQATQLPMPQERWRLTTLLWPTAKHSTWSSDQQGWSVMMARSEPPEMSYAQPEQAKQSRQPYPKWNTFEFLWCVLCCVNWPPQTLSFSRRNLAVQNIMPVCPNWSQILASSQLLGWNQSIAIPTTTEENDSQIRLMFLRYVPCLYASGDSAHSSTNPLSALAKFPVATSCAFFLH